MSSITKRQFLGFGLGALALGGAAYGWRVRATSGVAPGFERKAMSVAEMRAANALIVDIRRPDEWVDTGVIDGARLVTFVSPQSFLDAIGPEIADGRDLILICRSGNRSSLAAEALAGMIPNRIISVNGGMSQQIAQGYQTVRPVCATC
ncbi:MAG: rhodanese-like domain-containing protein [Alphaproteobacteria bacterium HGW-Alphaproteobacteria-4]|nr:MAG: rhodanese-like domain-containing protein [Alphaproteobacteria bacterium HGW-Alphaproteobacteria-4]